MLGLIVGAIGGLVQILTTFLPRSPFSDYLIALPDWTDTALGWLNWLVPVQACFNFFLAWLAAVAIYTAIRLIIDFAKGFGDRV